MSHKVPEIRADKNGKLVTRHIKPETHNQRSKGMPAPILKQDDYTLRSRIVEAMNLRGDRMNLEDVPSENLPALTAVVEDFDYTLMPNHIIKAAKDLAPQRFKECARLLLDHQNSAAEMLTASAYTDGRSDMPMLVTGLLYHQFPMDKGQEEALITGVCKLWSNDAMSDVDLVLEVFPRRLTNKADSPRGVAIDDGALKEDLAQLIVNNPDKLGIIIDCVTNRLLTNADDVSEIVNNSAAPALSQGSL